MALLSIQPVKTQETRIVYRPAFCGRAMSDERGLPRTADEVQEFMDELAFDEPPTAQAEPDMLASLPAGSEVMVVRSVRLPLDVDQAVATPQGGGSAQEHVDQTSHRSRLGHAGRSGRPISRPTRFEP